MSKFEKSTAKFIEAMEWEYKLFKDLESKYSLTDIDYIIGKYNLKVFTLVGEICLYMGISSELNNDFAISETLALQYLYYKDPTFNKALEIAKRKGFSIEKCNALVLANLLFLENFISYLKYQTNYQ